MSSFPTLMMSFLTLISVLCFRGSLAESHAIWMLWLVQVIDVFYTADEDQTGGLDKKELERALSRVMDVRDIAK